MVEEDGAWEGNRWSLDEMMIPMLDNCNSENNDADHSSDNSTLRAILMDVTSLFNHISLITFDSTLSPSSCPRPKGNIA